MWNVNFLVCFLGLFIGTTSGSRKGVDIGQLLEIYPFNKYLIYNVPKPFQIVYPKQIRKNELVGISTKEFQISHHGTHDHYQHVTYQIIIEGKKHKLRLERNDDLLSAGIRVKYFEDAQQQVISQTVEHCYYQGTVKRDDWSAVAVSTCNGIRGLIQLHNETYIIQPLQGGDEGLEHPHIVYKGTSSDTEKCGNDHGKWLPFNELHKGEYRKKLKSLNVERPRRDTDDGPEKFLKLALVLDNSVFSSLNLTEEEMLDYAIQTANVVDLYYKELKIRMALTYVEMWNRGDQISVTPQLRETLENFLFYQSKHLNDVDHHAAQLITGVEFEQSSVGMAIPDSVCTGRAVGINKYPSLLEPQQGAAILAHMIGHNLGIKHDEDGGCECSDEFGCIMSTDVLAMPEKHSRMFSTCSASDWYLSLNMGIAACLTENPESTFPQTCGNRHVERGEECDCGSPEDCEKTDQCCDPHTCLLKYWAQCRSGACCHNCTYLSSNYMCRPQSTDCDVAEFCTGEDGQCPPNNYAKDSHPCGNNTGYCLGGICPSLDKQCQGIWGDEAVAADRQCFERFNPTGNFNGHCGKDDKTGSYAKCLPENIQCGLLHCDGGNKIPYYGPDKDSSKTTVTSNGIDFECKIVHGPAVLQLPHMGLVQDGTKCGEGRICMGTECVPTSVLPPLNCPSADSDLICSGHGICTKGDVCVCDEGWMESDCAASDNVTRVILSIERVTTPPVPTTTTDRIKIIPMDISYSTARPTSTEIAAAVVQAEEAKNLNTKWMVIILASVIGGLGLILVLTFLCYWRRSPVKFNRKKKKKLFGGSSEDCLPDNPNKLIKFGNLPSYKSEKNSKKGKKGKGRSSTEDDSDIGELPPPPVIIVDPDSAKPEKGILKNSFASLKFANERRSSESNTATSDGNCDDSVDPYDDEDDTEAGEIQDILSGEFEPEQSLDALDNMVESSSFDFMLPPPFGNGNLSMFNRSPSPQRRFGGYDIPVTNPQPTRPNMWKSNLQSPSKPRKLRMRNLDEILQQIDRHTIDLSPSPDDPPVQISPSTSEDVRSSSTDDRHYQTSSHDPQSPTSITSGSTCTALRPLLGSQWSKYVLHRNRDNGESFDLDDIESPLPHIKIPPPMNPINIRSIYNYGQTNLNRDNNDTPLGSQSGECCSNNGTANSRNGYEKSSGYGSEHDPERFSIEDMSRNQSRSGSASPPTFSAVIRTGPNQIKLVPASKLQSQGGYYEDDLHKLLDGLPRIDAGCYERSPLSVGNAGNSMSSTLETIKNSLPDYSSSEFNSNTNTMVNSDISNTLEKGDMEEKISNLETSVHSRMGEHTATNTLEMLKQSIPEFSNGHFPNPKPLGDKDNENSGSAPCIDRSLEEIPLAITDSRKSKKKRKDSLSRPVSLSVFKQQGSTENENEEDSLLCKRYSAIDKVPIDICEC